MCEGGAESTGLRKPLEGLSLLRVTGDPPEGLSRGATRSHRRVLPTSRVPNAPTDSTLTPRTETGPFRSVTAEPHGANDLLNEQSGSLQSPGSVGERFMS